MTYNFLVWVCSGIYGIMRYLHICKGNNLGLKLLFAGSKKADVSLLFCHHRPCRYPWSYGARMYHCVARPCNVPNFTIKFIEKEDIRRPTQIFFFDVSDCTFALAQGGLYVQCAICKSDSREHVHTQLAGKSCTLHFGTSSTAASAADAKAHWRRFGSSCIARTTNLFALSNCEKSMPGVCGLERHRDRRSARERALPDGVIWPADQRQAFQPSLS